MKALPIFTCTILLTAATSHAEEEAWYLEMEPRFADLIISKYHAEDKKSYLQALDMIPNLVKDGKITEIEKIANTPDQKGGTHFPKDTIQVEKPVKFAREIGSGYYRGHGNNLRIFEIQTKKEFFGIEWVISIGSLPKQWMPSFTVNNGTTVKLLLERDTSASPEFFEIKQRLHMARTQPDSLTATWFLTKPVLDAIPTAEIKSDTVFEYANTQEFTQEDLPEMKSIGASLIWRLNQDKTFNLETGLTKIASKAPYSQEVFRATGNVSEQGTALKADLTLHLEETKDGQPVREEKPSPGAVEYGILPIAQ